MTIDTLLLALSLVLILEGLGPALFPNKWRRLLTELTAQPTGVLRMLGVGLLLCGWLLFLFVSP